MHKQYIPLNLLTFFSLKRGKKLHSFRYKLEDPRGGLILLELIIEGFFLGGGGLQVVGPLNGEAYKWGGGCRGELPLKNIHRKPPIYFKRPPPPRGVTPDFWV